MIKKLRIGQCVTAQRSYPLPSGVIWAPIPLAMDLLGGLKAKGHNITLYASKNTNAPVKVSSGELVCGVADPKFRQRLEKQRQMMPLENTYFHLFDQYLLMRMIQDANRGKLDVIHSHSEAVIPLAHLSHVPVLVTIHNPYNPYGVELIRLHRKSGFKLVSLSMAQRKPLRNIVGMFGANVPNGIDLNAFPFSNTASKRFLFAGRLIEQKGVEDAIVAAKSVRQPLDVIGRHYSKSYLAKLKRSESKSVRFLGNKDRSEMYKYYGEARAVLFPTKWDEPFGLVMVEAMACGTPVIAYDRGSVREVIKDGVTGFIVKNEKQMAAAMKKIDTIDRAACRKWVEKKFSKERMVDDYEKLYYKAVKHWGK